MKHIINTVLKEALKTAKVDVAGLGKDVEAFLSKAPEASESELSQITSKNGLASLRGKTTATITVSNAKEEMIVEFISLSLATSKFLAKADVTQLTLGEKLSSKLREVWPMK